MRIFYVNTTLLICYSLWTTDLFFSFFSWHKLLLSSLFLLCQLFCFPPSCFVCGFLQNMPPCHNVHFHFPLVFFSSKKIPFFAFLFALDMDTWSKLGIENWNMPPCHNVHFHFPLLSVLAPFFVFPFYLRYGYLKQTWNWKLETWWDLVQLPATQFVVEVWYILDGWLWIHTFRVHLF